MAIAVAKLLISAMAVVMLLSSSFATADEEPFMLVHKKAALNRLKSGAEQVLVSIDVYNQGSSTAYNVTLTDSSWDKDTFQAVIGNTSRSWERLDADGAPALVTFRIPTKTALQAKKLVAKYGSLVSVISFVVLFIYLIATPSKNNAAKASNTKR